jgi:hypothetical protein
MLPEHTCKTLKRATNAPAQVRGRVAAIRRADPTSWPGVKDRFGVVGLGLSITTLEGTELWVSVSERGYKLIGTPGVLKEAVDYESLHALLAERSSAYIGKFAGLSLPVTRIRLSAVPCQI